MNLFQVIRRPIITEKSTGLRELSNQYVFEVALQANKQQISSAIENLFKVHVTAVRVLRVRGKLRRYGRNRGKSSNWKKAIVTLNQGEKLEFMEGV